MSVLWDTDTTLCPFWFGECGFRLACVRVYLSMWMMITNFT